MSIGAGIAIAAMWGAVVGAMFAPDVTGGGLVLVTIAAVSGTFIVVGATCMSSADCLRHCRPGGTPDKGKEKRV